MIGVVCAGAGARGAYEAGALSVLLSWVLPSYPEKPVVLLGTSAGAINAALFAGVLDRQRSPEEAVEKTSGCGAPPDRRRSSPVSARLGRASSGVVATTAGGDRQPDVFAATR